jgi:hypothetical protein
LRILIVDHYYDAVVDWIYRREPGLSRAPYATQRERIDTYLFGQTAFEVAALRDLGHEAWDCLVNIRPLQDAFAREHGATLSPTTTWGFARRRGLPWPRRRDQRWIGEALLLQVRALQPDVVHVQSMDVLSPELIAEVRRETRLVVGQIAADLPADRGYGAYDLVVSSVPNLVERFRMDGIPAALLPLAFEPALADSIAARERDVPASFVGSLSASHPDRIRVLDAVAAAVPLHIWTADVGALPPGSPLRKAIRGVAWGRDMYEVLARSRITINNHARIAQGASNNLRLFEATGMGALLVTDSGTNLGELFEEGREVVTYHSPAECAELVRHYLDNPEAAGRIAAAGQRRTLTEHTWRSRMEQLSGIIGSRI